MQVVYGIGAQLQKVKYKCLHWYAPLPHLFACVLFQVDGPPSRLILNVIIECPHFRMKTQVELLISGWIFYKNSITYFMALTSKIHRFYPKWCTSCVRLGCQKCHWIRIYLYKLVLIKAFLSFLMVIIEKIMAISIIKKL